MVMPKQIARITDSTCELTMVESGAGVTVCPERYSEEAVSDVAVEPLPKYVAPICSATGSSVRAFGRRAIDYALGSDKRITVTWIITNASCVIISSNMLRMTRYSINCFADA